MITSVSCYPLHPLVCMHRTFEQCLLASWAILREPESSNKESILLEQWSRTINSSAEVVAKSVWLSIQMSLEHNLSCFSYTGFFNSHLDMQKTINTWIIGITIIHHIWHFTDDISYSSYKVILIKIPYMNTARLMFKFSWDHQNLH
jgi:hypothetical protein